MVVRRTGKRLGQHGFLLDGAADSVQKRSSEKTLRLLRRWGTLPLLFAWLPVIGDALPIAAGWLRLNPYTSALMLLTGKILRYSIILAGIKGMM